MFTRILALPMFLACCLLASQAVAQDDWMDPIYGNWQCNVDKTVKLMEEDKRSEDEIKQAKDFLGGIGMTIGKDSTLLLVVDAEGFKDETSAKFEISNSNEEKKWLELTVTMEHVDDAKTGEITIVDKDTLKLETDDGEMMVFSRKKEEEKKDGK